MTTQSFYLALFPSAGTNQALPYYYSKVFTLSYSSPVDLGNQQAAKAQEFKLHLRITQNYNSDWYVGNEDAALAAADRTTEIADLRRSNQTVLEPNWP